MKLLWVRREPALEGGGDAIVDQKFSRELSRRHEVLVHAVPRRVGRDRIAASLMRRVPPDRGAFGSPPDIETIVALAGQDCDVILFSHEQLDALAREVARRLGPARPLIGLLLHNVPSDALPQLARRPAVGWLAGQIWTAYERRSFSSEEIDEIFTLSRRDAGLVARLGGRREVHVVHPGAPPADALAAGAPLRPDLVVIGTFEWFPKRRDLLAFAEDYLLWNETPRPKVYLSPGAEPEHVARLGAGSLTDIDFREAIRFGLVTDRFVAGHKLKVSEYFARNLIPVSFSGIGEDFAFSEAASRLIARIDTLGDLGAHIRRMTALPPHELRALFLQAKEDVLARMSWQRQTETMTQALSRALGRLNSSGTRRAASAGPPDG